MLVGDHVDQPGVGGEEPLVPLHGRVAKTNIFVDPVLDIGFHQLGAVHSGQLQRAIDLLRQLFDVEAHHLRICHRLCPLREEIVQARVKKPDMRLSVTEKEAVCNVLAVLLNGIPPQYAGDQEIDVGGLFLLAVELLSLPQSAVQRHLPIGLVQGDILQLQIVHQFFKLVHFSLPLRADLQKPLCDSLILPEPPLHCINIG